MSPNRQRLLAFTVVSSACVAFNAAPAIAEEHGKLLAGHSAAPRASLDTRFSNARAASSFLLVVTESKREPLSFAWSVRCEDADHRESGGASGRATVSNGHWVKRVSPDWIAHPASCSGSIRGVAAGAPVLVRMIAA